MLPERWQTGRMPFDLAAIGAGLPVREALPGLTAALADGGVAVVHAPPGTGKTTLIPPSLANLVDGKVVVTQPRRIAARAGARRLAQLSATTLGDEVGFVVRGDQAVSARTRVEFCTAGVLLRRLLTAPDLEGIDAVVLDEVHERAIETDLAFAMVAELRELRPDLALVVMSATLDATRWADLLGGAPVLSVAADLHPLEIRWAPGPQRLDQRGLTRPFLDHLAGQAVAVLAETDSAVLVFAPGARECDEVAERVRTHGVPVQVLHGSLAPAAQNEVLARSDPRVIVATSLAESALTVPGVRAVVDSGLAREPRHDTGRAMTGLVTVSEARSSAEQRSGRAARLGPGLAVRCFPESDWVGMRPFTTPEILTADLTQTALDLAVWGAPRGAGLALPDTPNPAAMEAATQTLRSLAALDEDEQPTVLGRRLAGLPVEPRLGRALLETAASVGTRQAAEVVALLSSDVRPAGADLVGAWRAPASRQLQVEATRLTRLVDHHPRPTGLEDDELVATVVTAAFPDRIARRRRDGDDYLLASGTAGSLPPKSRLHGQQWLAVAQIGRVGDRAVIRAAAPLTEAAAADRGSALLSEASQATWSGGRVTARRTVRLGAIELSSTPVQPTADQGREAVRRALADRGLPEVLGWGQEVERLRRRLALLRDQLGEPWPQVDDEALVQRAEEWLGPELGDLARGVAASRIDLMAALRRLLPWPAASQFDTLAPERLQVPTGSRIRLDYPELPTERVVLPVKLQECFGLLDTPRIVDGRVPVLLHLLSPAGRPLAVTDDLASFWVNAYPAVRAENRGRYSKHPWPEDPLTAPPRKGTSRSGR